MKSAPILITVYNRLEHFKKCIDSLKQCDLAKQSILYISSDAAFRKEDEEVIQAIRKYVVSIQGFLEIIPIFHQDNKGLEFCYEYAISEIFKNSDTFIFLEDDIVVAPNFLKYLNEGLEYYQDSASVISISAFSHAVFFPRLIEDNKGQIYFTNRWCPWGFATWRHKIELVSKLEERVFKDAIRDENFIQKLNTIGIDLHPAFLNLAIQDKLPTLDLRYCFNMVYYELFTCTPYETISFNIGNDGEGTRTKKNSKYTNFEISSLNTQVLYSFSNFSLVKVNNSFNYFNNNSNLNKLKLILNKFGLLQFGYILNDYNKKWKRKK